MSKSKNYIFCNLRIQRHRGNNESCVKGTSSQKIKDIIRILTAQQSVAKIQFCETSEYVMYHKSCFNQNNKLVQNSDLKTEENEQNSQWKNLRDIHSTVFTQLKSYLAEKILERREILALSDVYNCYMR